MKKLTLKDLDDTIVVADKVNEIVDWINEKDKKFAEAKKILKEIEEIRDDLECS